ncbi:MAG: helix-turn-helix domain-containing protein [Bifidobacteriaceae bacterium]|jgi:transcriptional regulator with XRE-family HTH domain|nr:helix-turn-helix domain-containing protein [Bifidobacteriaceae bacterium]
MGSRPPTGATLAAAGEIGQQLATWRKLLGLTAEQVADRAGIARGTLRRLERGDLGVGLGAVLSVAAGLGVLDRIVLATDPYETDLGRARADQALPKRVRR